VKERRKPGSTWGNTTAEVLRMLEEYGPMTRAEICKQLGRDKTAIAAVVSRLHKASTERPQRIFIKAYVYDQEGERYYPRAVFALGSKKDAPRPKRNVAAVRARYWARKTVLMKANSVFHLGLSRETLRQMHKQVKAQSCNTSSESTQA
jgi:hypothetical protein